MLVLDRRVNQRIRINDDITILLVSARDGKAKIGIEAPQDVVIHREEVYQAIKRREEGQS